MRIENDDYLEYARRRVFCEWCGAPSIDFHLDPHHIEAKGMDAGKQLDIPLNILSVHRACHEQIERGGRKSKILCWKIVAKREGLGSWKACEQAVWRILRRPKS